MPGGFQQCSLLLLCTAQVPRRVNKAPQGVRLRLAHICEEMAPRKSLT